MSEALEATANTENDLDAIVASLDSPLDVLPEQAIRAAQMHKEAMIPRLIGLIEEATRVWEDREVRTNGPFLALFLLAEFHARAGLPAIMKAVSLPGEGPCDLFGAAIHDALPGALAVLAGKEDLDLVLALIDNPKINMFVRWNAARALVAMVGAGIRSRDEIVALLRSCLRAAIDQKDTDIIVGLVDSLADLYPEEAYEEIMEAFEKKLVDEMVITPGDIEDALENGSRERVTNNPPLIEDTLKMLRDSFNEEEDVEYEFQPPPPKRSFPTRPAGLLNIPPPVPPPLRPITHAQKRVGRNDPCPCGSGKKFKKCCWLRK